MFLQTYPRPDYTIDQILGYGNENARLFIMRSKDLENWSIPKLLNVKGDSVNEIDIGRMIDPFLLQDQNKKINGGYFTSKMVRADLIFMI